MQDPLLDCEGDIRDYLAEHTTTQCPPLLAQAMEYAVFPGGARVRPQLCMAVALANNSSDRPLAAAAATAVEFLHCASLVHDDLPCFDDATERRGKPSVHAKFGERIAVLKIRGDAFFDEAVELCVEFLVFLRIIFGFAIEEFEEALGDETIDLLDQSAVLHTLTRDIQR